MRRTFSLGERLVAGTWNEVIVVNPRRPRLIAESDRRMTSLMLAHSATVAQAAFGQKPSDFSLITRRVNITKMPPVV
jgi:hypothetical protein